MKKCTICGGAEVYEDSPILVMGAYGIPKCLCDTCAKDMECATGGKDYAEIEAAMERLGKRMSDFSADKQTYETVNGLLLEAAERAKKIKDGSYDFSLDEQPPAEDELLDIPEELLESREDAELDRADEEKQKKFDKFFNWVTIGAFAGALGFVIYKLLERFVF